MNNSLTISPTSPEVTQFSSATRHRGSPYLGILQVLERRRFAVDRLPGHGGFWNAKKKGATPSSKLNHCEDVHGNFMGFLSDFMRF
jgi:hypothetical protein